MSNVDFFCEYFQAIHARSALDNTVQFDNFVSQLNATEEAEDDTNSFLDCVQVNAKLTSSMFSILLTYH